MIAAEPAAAIEGLKALTAHARSGNLADGLAMERDILGRALSQRDRPAAHTEFAERQRRQAGQGWHAAQPGMSSRTQPAGTMTISLVKPNRPRFTDVEGSGRDGRTWRRFGVGGHHFARLPIALLRAIATFGRQGFALRLLGRRICRSNCCLKRMRSPKSTSAFPASTSFGLPPSFRAAAETVPCRSATGRRWP